MAGESEEARIENIRDLPPPNIFSPSISAIKAEMDSTVTLVALNSLLFGADARCCTVFFPLSAEGEGAALVSSGVRVLLATLPSVVVSAVWAHLAAWPPITMAPTAWIDGISKGAAPVPSSELLPTNSLGATGSLMAFLGAKGV